MKDRAGQSLYFIVTAGGQGVKVVSGAMPSYERRGGLLPSLFRWATQVLVSLLMARIARGIVMRHLSFVICHLSFVIRHLSFVICHWRAELA
jgi:hypothetical protein